MLLAHEGINGTLAGDAEAIASLVEELQHGELFGGRLNDLELKFSEGKAMPFGRLKIRLKKEIVTLGDANADPTRQVGIYVDPIDVECADRFAGYARDRYAQCVRGGDGDF